MLIPSPPCNAWLDGGFPVRNSRTRHAVLLGLAMSASAAPVSAAGPASGTPSPADIAAHRQALLNDMLTKDSAYVIAGQRWLCAMGKEPAQVAKARAQGAYFFPDAADSCVAALIRTARDRQLPTLYGKLLTELGIGQGDGARLPEAIGAVVMNGAEKVPIGNGKAMVVTSAIAFDAGFTVGYWQGAGVSGAVNVQQLKVVSEDCLGQRRDAATCFSAGHVHGARAFNARTVSAR